MRAKLEVKTALIPLIPVWDVFFFLSQNDETLLGYMLKTSGHTCMHIVNLVASWMLGL